jgi:hypothetical protein
MRTRSVREEAKDAQEEDRAIYALDSVHSGSAFPIPVGLHGFSDAPELEAVVEELIEEMEELDWLRDYVIKCSWKAKGMSDDSKPVLGKCQAPSGLLQHYSHADWIIWIAVDNVATFNGYSMKALLYHEMLHCQLVGKLKQPGVRPHDVEMFIQEVERFGPWKGDLERASDAFASYAPA